jgi:hypothetical protein
MKGRTKKGQNMKTAILTLTILLIGGSAFAQKGIETTVTATTNISKAVATYDTVIAKKFARIEALETQMRDLDREAVILRQQAAYLSIQRDALSDKGESIIAGTYTTETLSVVPVMQSREATGGR